MRQREGIPQGIPDWSVLDTDRRLVQHTWEVGIGDNLIRAISTQLVFKSGGGGQRIQSLGIPALWLTGP